MAGVNWEKLHGAGEAKAQFRHSDKDMRMIMNHSNKDIDRTKTCLNLSAFNKNYAAVCREYDRRIAGYDARCTRKPRKDRVTCISLEVPAPEELDPADEDRWFQAVCGIVQKQFGEDQFLQGYWHKDEQHWYTTESGGRRLSRNHAHIYVFPDVDGRLCAKEFVTKARMTALNNAVEEMSMQSFGAAFQTGEKLKSGESVEALKLKSRQKQLEQMEKRLASKSAKVDEREKAVRSREADIARREASMTRSEAQTATRLSEAGRLYRNAENALKEAQVMREWRPDDKMLETAMRAPHESQGQRHGA